MNRTNKNLIFTIPNILSILRILLIAPIVICVWHDNLKPALLLTAIAIATDFFDGKIARYFNRTSELGKMLDPIADKLGIAALLIVLLLKDKIPMWVVVLVIGRDVIIAATSLFVAKKYKIITPSNFIGKLAANSIAFMIVAYVFDIIFMQKIFLPLTVFFIFLSGYSYLRRFINIQISAKQHNQSG